MKNYKTALSIFLLLGITIFSAFKYISSFKEKYDLSNALNKIKSQVTDLQQDKQNLLQELEKGKELQQQLNQNNAELTDKLKASEEKLARVDEDFAQAQNEIEQLNSEMVTLKAETVALSEEKDSLKARLSSVEELKKAIKELKKQVRKVSIEVKKEIRRAGNRGYVIKNGKSTYPGKVKIEIMPVP